MCSLKEHKHHSDIFLKTLIFQFWSNWVAGWLGVEDKLVQWFGLDQSKYQWAIDEYMDRQLVSFSLHDLSLSLSCVSAMKVPH
jgi:hypothetical protein